MKEVAYKMTWTWLRRGNVRRETKFLFIAVQNNVIRTNHVKGKIDNTLKKRKYKLWDDKYETDNNIINKCKRASMIGWGK